MSVCLSGNLLIIMRTTVILQSSAPMFLCMLKVHSTWSIFSLFLQSWSQYLLLTCQFMQFFQLSPVCYFLAATFSSLQHQTCLTSAFPASATLLFKFVVAQVPFYLCPEYNKYDPRSTCSSSLAPPLSLSLLSVDLLMTLSSLFSVATGSWLDEWGSVVFGGWDSLLWVC